MRTKRNRLLLVVTVLAMVIAACGGGGGGSDTTEAADSTETTAGGEATTTTADSGTDTTEGDQAAEPVTVEWWHIQNNDPGLSLWQAVADEFMAENPHVTIDITVQENEAFKQSLQTNLQAGDVPDIFQSWGGGGLREQVDAGLVMDITDAVAAFDSEFNDAAASMMEIDGRMYGVPFDLGIVGIWYNTTLFEEAGIDGPPSTWDELLEDVQALKDAGITPISLAAGDKWPAMFWYGYMALRIAGADVMQQAGIDQNFNDPAFVQAGEELQRLIELDPFQPGFLATPWDGPDGAAAVVANSEAAMMLMGHWAPGTMQANGPDLAESGELGWFIFPEVEGGAGEASDAFGGGNGFAVGKDAPPEALEFLEYLSSVDVASRVGSEANLLPTTNGSEDSITDPNLVGVIEARGAAGYVQLYLDQAYPPEVGAAVNDSIVTVFAGSGEPQDVVDAVNASWE
ncbi:MAG TPA: extracellular solute-binding protein [Acidimicrobiia bacterium]|nr:extracellular solute-binding protein [Acidimicrobiia bacterium]